MAKMVTCKTCGAEIAKTAKRCPQCGAQQHKGVYIACAIIIVITFFGCRNALKNDQKQAENVPASAAVATVEVTAHDLWKAYDDNKVNADNLYKGQQIAVTGVITDIGQDIITKLPCISLDSGAAYGLSPIQCFFPEGYATDQIAALQDGQTITIYGKCTGVPVTTVQVTACSF